MGYDYVIILCADKKDESGVFPDTRDGKYIGGSSRMSAALKYSLDHPETTYIVVGGFDKNGRKSQKVDDMADYLKEGNTSIKIVTVPSLPCTHHNFVAIFNKMQDELVGKSIAIFTSHHHLPRALALYNRLVEKEFPKMPMAHVLCAEAFEENGVKSIIENAESYFKRFALEAEGLFDLESNRYLDYCLEKEKECFGEIATEFEYLTTEFEKEFYGLKKESVEAVV